ncbi:hypothetical protein [Paraburkholderia humisilvae]|uniref:Uncharacterized protein n=1 Tax=Paraburkholderia humisilvae TaxID=627669 RepID=A0A6J5DLQ4_9BURK|nr:hypothetical protein [Paraburkholderia humisilvae]CAB3754102.1 hypothetical protein LMG29542_02249 [Paraburkholderia humisilvae]
MNIYIEPVQPHSGRAASRVERVQTYPRRSLRDALLASTRKVSFGAYVGEWPDPIAQVILQSRDFGALADRIREIGIDTLAPLSGGASSVVLKAGENKVLRLGTGELTSRPDIPEVLQPLEAGTVGYLRYELTELADTASVSDADALRMREVLRTKGFEWGDMGVDNIGRIHGRVVVFDPGGITAIANRPCDSDPNGARESNTEILARLRSQTGRNCLVMD